MNYGKNEVARKLQRSSSKAQKVASKLVLWLVKLVLVLFTVGIILSVSLGYGIFKGIIDAAPEIDLSYTACGFDVKEAIVVKAPQAAYRYAFRLTLDGLTPAAILEEMDDEEERSRTAKLLSSESGAGEQELRMVADYLRVLEKKRKENEIKALKEKMSTQQGEEKRGTLIKIQELLAQENKTGRRE